MPFATIQLRGGVNSVQTPTLNQTGIASSNLIRFRDGLVEKLGGWVSYVGQTMSGVVRCLHAWQDLTPTKWLATGDGGVKVISNGVVLDITPQTMTSDFAPNFSTTAGSKTVVVVDANINTLTTFDAIFFNTPISVGGLIITEQEPVRSIVGANTYTFASDRVATALVNNAGVVPQFTTILNSNVVTVTFPGHNLSQGGKFTFPMATAVGGLQILGTYLVDSVTGANSFTISSGGLATSSTSAFMNGGNARLTYLIGRGATQATTTVLFGPIGMFALGPWAITTSTVGTQSGVPIVADDWTFDNWGELLLACPRGGAIWYWNTTWSGQTSSMVPVGAGPAFSNGIFVAMPQQILVAWGSTSSIDSGNTDSQLDPLIVRWSDQLDFFTWKVTSLDQAGSFHIPTGSEIRGAIQGATQAYIFTDLDCWAMQYLGPPLVFGFNQIGTGCGLVGPHAVTNLYGRTYWMNDSNFFVTGAGIAVKEIPCPVFDSVFQDVDRANITKCVAAANSQFNEIAFYYPSISGGTGECDKYAKYNVTTNLWDTGSLSRSAWTDRSGIGNPIGANPDDMMLYQHEIGYGNNGAAMDSWFETGYAVYGDAENFATVDYLEPDMKWHSASDPAHVSTVDMTVTAAKSPNGDTMSNLLTLTSTTSYVTPRLRGRQMKFKLESDDATSFWRLGALKYRFSVDGRR